MDLGPLYQAGQWYDLGLLVDYRGNYPVLIWQLNGQTIYSVVDTTTGPAILRPNGCCWHDLLTTDWRDCVSMVQHE